MVIGGNMLYKLISFLAELIAVKALKLSKYALQVEDWAYGRYKGGPK